MEKIYVSVASCQEPFLMQTIQTAFQNAEFPDRIYMGIFNTILNENYQIKNKINNLPYKNNIVYVELHSDYPMGVGYSRMNASLLINNDVDYYFQIDAQTIFDKNWDSVILKNYKDAEEKNKTDKIILTGAPFGCNYVNDNKVSIVNNNENLCEIDIYNFNSQDLNNFKIENPVPQPIFEKIQYLNTEETIMPIYSGKGRNTNPEECLGIHAAYVFYKYKFVKDLLNDPKDFFHGDQTNFSIRLLSRNFKILSYKYPVLLNYQKYDKFGQLEKYDWRNFVYQTDYLNNLQKNSIKNYKMIFSGEYIGYWGAESLKKLNYAKINITKGCVQNNMIENKNTFDKKEKCNYCDSEGLYNAWLEGQVISVCLKHLGVELVS